MGYVEPRNVKVTVGPAIIEERDASTNTSMRFTLNIVEGYIGVECELDQFTEELLSPLSLRVIEIARVAVDLVSFQSGYGFFIYIDKYIRENGEEITLMMKKPFLASLCTAYSADDFKEIFDMVVYDPNLFMALNDLVVASSVGRQAPTNCARAIEGIRNLIAPMKSDTGSWGMMKAALNVSEDYLRYITDLSKDHRHGKRIWMPSEPLEATVRRSWKVMNRYLILRKRQLDSLPLSEFPLLTSADS